MRHARPVLFAGPAPRDLSTLVSTSKKKYFQVFILTNAETILATQYAQTNDLNDKIDVKNFYADKNRLKSKCELTFQFNLSFI